MSPLRDLLFVVVLVVVAVVVGGVVAGIVVGVFVPACCRDLALASSSSCTGSHTRCKATEIKVKNVQHTFHFCLLFKEMYQFCQQRKQHCNCWMHGYGAITKWQELRTVMVIRIPLKNRPNQ